MTLVLGLYSPDAQSGKSTASRLVAARFSTETIKISGAMKTMCAVAIADLVEASDLDDWVDGGRKDTIVPGLLPTCSKNPAIADALILAMGASLEDEDLPLHDRNGQPLTRSIVEADLILAWGQALGLLYAKNGGLTPRDLQKTLGLEVGRKLYGDDFWIRLIAQRVATSTADVVIVDDVRFPDDAAFVVGQEGVLVRIARPSAQRIDDHPSEGLLEDHAFDVRIDNDSTLEAYQERVLRDLLPLLDSRV